MASVYEIIQGINQAAANAYDGAYDERIAGDGKAVKAGLKREKGCPINDSRVMDGFGVRFAGDQLIVTYHSEIPINRVHDNRFKDEVEQDIADVVKFLKKEYKKITGNGLTLSAQGDASVHAQNMSKVRSWVQATKTYKIGGLGDMDEIGPESSEDRLDKAYKSFLAIGKDQYPGTKKPKNVTSKKAD